MSAILQGQAGWRAQTAQVLQVERLVSVLLQEHVLQAVHLVKVGCCPCSTCCRRRLVSETGCVEGMVGWP